MNRIFIFGSFARRFILLFSALCILASGASTASAGEAVGYFAVDSFLWKEFDEDGTRLVKESGPLFGVGFSYQAVYQNDLIFTPAIELFGGRVDYEGQACSITTGICIASTSNVRYFGVKLDGDLGMRFGEPGDLSVEPFVGIGLRSWLRDIADGMAADGSPTAGYSEEWFTLNGRVGIRAAGGFGRGNQVFVQGGVKLPIYNSSTAYLSDIGFTNDTTVEPGKKLSFFAETGVRVDRLQASMFYESLRFSKSNVDQTMSIFDARPRFFLQPKSSMDLYGVKLAYVF